MKIQCRACQISLVLALVAPIVGGAGCAVVPGELARIQSQLEARSPSWVAEHRPTFESILAQGLAVDSYHCMPFPDDVFFGDTAVGTRVIWGEVPHYGVVWGPMHYRVTRATEGWLVQVRYAVDPPSSDTLELPDCKLSESVPEMTCEGAPYSTSDSVDACPKVGAFRAPNTRASVDALLVQWSREVEEYYNRDAKSQGLPIRYDFEFQRASEGVASDIHLPLSSSCGRTPYFVSVRSGWSLPVLAHEVGHVMGLVDEYEMFSGIVGFYPKTPFLGAEKSRMGLSMRESSVVLPLHHYLILRRYFCPEPSSRDPFGDIGLTQVER